MLNRARITNTDSFQAWGDSAREDGKLIVSGSESRQSPSGVFGWALVTFSRFFGIEFACS